MEGLRRLSPEGSGGTKDDEVSDGLNLRAVLEICYTTHQGRTSIRTVRGSLCACTRESKCTYSEIGASRGDFVISLSNLSGETIEEIGRVQGSES